MGEKSKIILGGGITGLSAGVGCQREIYEANDIAGGICASYYIGGDGKKYFSPTSEEAYRFELGGGHWIFGADKEVLDFIECRSSLKTYKRKSSVYFPDMDLYVPYPIQNHLYFLPKDLRERALNDILKSKNEPVLTLADWLENNFGRTLCELFFFPFHELYTANLYAIIAPQDKFKSPVNRELIISGASEATPAIGYNATFAYPERGLDDLIRKLAENCRINFGKKVVKLNLEKKELFFEDGSGIKYDKIISTLPLNRMLEMSGLNIGKSDPFTSVLVINVGAKKGIRCPEDHWLYIPRSKAGFHRVGFYSNVDSSFVPNRSRDRVSIYVEKAYKGGQKPGESELNVACKIMIEELQSWGFIGEVEVVDSTWIEIAYTWEYPDSQWKQEAIKMLEKNDIFVTGRYGKWQFQGIMDSIKDGLSIDGM